MKPLISKCFAALLVVLGVFAGTGAESAARTVNRVIAVVNDDVITEAEVGWRVQELFESRGIEMPDGEIPPRVIQLALRQLVDERLIVQEAKRLGIEVSQDEVTERVKSVRERYPSDEEFKQWLFDSHMSLEQFRRTVRDKLLTQRAVDAQVRSRISVSPQEIAEEMEKNPKLKQSEGVLLAHILVRVGEMRSDAEAKRLITNIFEKAKAGAQFLSLAQRYSDDARAREGKPLGWVIRGQLMPELDEVAFSTPEGEFSEPIRTGLGYHLIKVEKRHSPDDLNNPISQVVLKQIYENKFNQAMADWLDRLTEQAYIETTEELDD